MIIDKVRAGAGVDDIRATISVQGLRARAAGNGVGGGRAQDREGAGKTRRGDVLEVLHRGRTGRLVGGVRQIDVDRNVEDEGVGRAGTAVDGGLQAMIVDRVDARTGDDQVACATVAIDRIPARAAADRIGGRRADDRHSGRHAAPVDVGYALDRDAASRGLAQGVGEVQVYRRIEIQSRDARTAVDRGLRPVEVDEVGPGGHGNDVAAAVAVDGFVARAAADRIPERRAQDRQGGRYAGGVDVGEAGHERRAADLIGRARQIDVGRDIEIERARSRAAAYGRFRSVIIDKRRAAVDIYHVGAAIAVDGVRR